MVKNTGAQIPANWAQYTVSDTIDIPVGQFWPISFRVSLEDIGNMAKYKDLPKIQYTTPVYGNFTREGDSRRVHFETGKTLLETIVKTAEPAGFGYELTEIEIPLRTVARRARGYFNYTALPDGKTRVEWTYGFEQKNAIAKWMINRYIKKTHKFWMKDTLSEIKRQTEKIYNNK